MKGVGDVVDAVGGDERRLAAGEAAAVLFLHARKVLLMLQRRGRLFLDVGSQRGRGKAANRIAIQAEQNSK